MTADESGKPLRMNRRITTTLPHSQMGKIRPSKPLMAMEAKAFLGRKRWSRSEEMKTSISPEIKDPRRRKGMPSKRTLRKE